MRAEYREEPCKVALNRVKGMGFKWSLNPYMGCVHQCTFCYVRHFELRADRPFDDRYGRSIRVKTNVAEMLRHELAKATWEKETVAIGAATDPYQPAEGRYRLTRACLEVLRDASNPISIITRGPLIVRDADVLAQAARRANVSVTFSVPTLDDEVWRRTEPGTAHPRQRLRALKTLVDAGIRAAAGVRAPLRSARVPRLRRVEAGALVGLGAGPQARNPRPPPHAAGPGSRAGAAGARYLVADARHTIRVPCPSRPPPTSKTMVRARSLA
jgi:DNA repair photolyase